jgi:hypothetical protein
VCAYLVCTAPSGDKAKLEAILISCICAKIMIDLVASSGSWR